MANRYWVGGTAAWDGTAGTKWATTSGGAGGAAVPTSSDDVFFDSNSGAGTVTVQTTNALCNNIDFTGYTGTYTDSGSVSLQVSGSLTGGSGMTMNAVLGMVFVGSGTITNNGKVFNFTVNAPGGTYSLGDNWVSSGNHFTLTAGTFDANGKNISGNDFKSNNSNTRTLTMGSGQWKLGSGTFWDTTTTTNLTFNVGTLPVQITAGGANTPKFGNLSLDIKLLGNASTFSIVDGGTIGIDCNGFDLGAFTLNAASTTVKPRTSSFTTSGIGSFTVTAGTFDANDLDSSHSVLISTGNATRSVLLKSGTMTLTQGGAGAQTVLSLSGTGLTFTAGTSTIKLTGGGNGTKTVASNGVTLNNLWFSGTGTGARRITGGPTINDLKIDAGLTLLITAATTVNVNTITSLGTSGSHVVIGSITAASQFTFNTSQPSVYVDYISISDSNATPGSTFFARHSTNTSNNTGWTFGVDQSVDVAETGSALDQVSQLYNVALAETGAVADVVTRTVDTTGAITESVSASESIAQTSVLVTAVTESLSAVDVQDSILVNTVQDTLSASDVLTAQNSALVSITETLAITDLVAGPVAFVGILNESGGTTDVISGLRFIFGDLVETLTVAEGVASSLVAVGLISESLVPVDAFQGFTRFGLDIEETVAITDVQSASYVLRPRLTEELDAAESVAGARSTNAILTNFLSAADALATTQVFVSPIAELVTVADLIDGAIMTTAAVSEVRTALDVVTGDRHFSGTLAEIGVATSGQNATVAFQGRLPEQLHQGDQFSATGIYNPSLAEALDLEDLVDAFITLTGRGFVTTSQRAGFRTSTSVRQSGAATSITAPHQVETGDS